MTKQSNQDTGLAIRGNWPTIAKIAEDGTIYPINQSDDQAIKSLLKAIHDAGALGLSRNLHSDLEEIKRLTGVVH